MTMFKRVRDSLVYPKELLNYRKDRIILVLFYLLFFAMLLSTRTVIDVIKFDGISNPAKDILKEEILVVEDDCAIVSATLICDGEHLIEVYEDTMFTIFLDSNETIDYGNYPSDSYAIIIHDEDVYVYFLGIDIFSVPLNELPSSLQNIDFNDQTANPDQFYENLFEGIDELIVSYKTTWGILLVVIEIVVSMIFYLIFILFSAWFLKRRFSVIPFKETFSPVKHFHFRQHYSVFRTTIY